MTARSSNYQVRRQPEADWWGQLHCRARPEDRSVPLALSAGPHDIWDLDSSSPVVLFDQTYNGQPRKGRYECSKTGWCYVLDRSNGQPLVGIDEKAVPQEPRHSTAPTQPYPNGDSFKDQCATPVEGFPVIGCLFTPYWDVPVMYRPALDGATTYNPIAYSPQTGLIYALGYETSSRLR